MVEFNKIVAFFTENYPSRAENNLKSNTTRHKYIKIQPPPKETKLFKTNTLPGYEPGLCLYEALLVIAGLFLDIYDCKKEHKNLQYSFK